MRPVLMAVLVTLLAAVLFRLLVDGDGVAPRVDSTARVPAGAETARVVSHVDGDTIRLAGEEGSMLLPRDRDVAVRLLEIDAPEVAGPYGGAECFGAEASATLAAMLPVGARVRVTRDTELHDPYGRMLLYLFDEDGRMVNLELVRQGYAESLLFEPNDEHIEAMRQAEAEARSAGRGRWGACG
jgi:micrococcal nuclease